MQCNCGGETKPAQHTVKTLAGALAWSDKVTESDLPVTINQDKCPACGRMMIYIKNGNRETIERRG